jgi:pre-rRNA-processing protein TSR2
VEDESEVAVARDILAVKKRLIEERTLDAAREVELRYRNRGQMKGSVAVEEINQDAEDDGVEWNGIDEEDEDEEMGGVPLLVPAAAPRERVEPEVDDDGFTKVVSKKKR